MKNDNCYVALLRGINVSGQKKILMKDLTVLFESCGFSAVRTYIQSGNIVFMASKSQELDTIIHNKIKEVYGWEVPVLILTPMQIQEILTHCPWSEVAQLKSYYTLLLDSPTSDAVNLVAQYKFEGEQFKIAKNCIYLKYDMGAGNAKMTNNFLENKLKVRCTSRNHRTMQKILALTSEN